MNFLRFALLAAAMLFVAACLPVTTKNPVGSTVGFSQDPELVGLWKGAPDKKKSGDEGEDKQGYLAFLNSGEDGTMTGLLIAPGKGSGDWGYYKLRPTMLGANHYLNAWAVMNNDHAADPDEAKSDFLLLYRIGKNGRLMLYLLDEDATRTAITAGKIRGVVDPGSMGDVHITAEPKELDAFFAGKQGAALFVKPFAVMDKVN
jgi:hypothetical protein